MFSSGEMRPETACNAISVKAIFSFGPYREQTPILWRRMQRKIAHLGLDTPSLNPIKGNP
jgi:hypothetical protein